MTKKHLVYILDDCESTTFLLKQYLSCDFNVSVFHAPSDFIRTYKNTRPEFCIIDVQLNSNQNGIDVLREAQSLSKSPPPFIFISQEAPESRKNTAYELGALDYIKKPLNQAELKHKVSNILHILKKSKQPQEENPISLNESNLTFTLIAQGKRKVVKLTPKEFIIFKQLIKNKNSIITREQMLQRLEESLNEKIVIDRVIDVHVCNIKRKLGPHKGVINSVYGVGYKFELKKVA